MGFRYESEMLQPTLRWLCNRGLLPKTEFRLPWGICDVVAASFDPKRVRDRRKLKQTKPIGPVSRVRLLQEIPEDRGIRLTTLQKRFGLIWEPDKVRREVETLKSRRFVLEVRRNTYEKVNGWMPLDRKLLAIELKLNAVPEALAQARNHISFASEAYVGLPLGLARRVKRDRRSECFHDLGIGLLGVSRTRIERLIPAMDNSGRWDSVMHAYCCERFWPELKTAKH